MKTYKKAGNMKQMGKAAKEPVSPITLDKLGTLIAKSIVHPITIIVKHVCRNQLKGSLEKNVFSIEFLIPKCKTG